MIESIGTYDEMMNTNLPLKFSFFMDLLSTLEIDIDQEFNIYHMIGFHRTINADIFSNENILLANLNLLSKVLPVALQFMKNKKAKYYPIHYSLNEPFGNTEMLLMPYFLITKRHALLLNSDLNSGIYIKDKQTINALMVEFAVIKEYTTSFIRNFYNSKQLQEYLCSQENCASLSTILYNGRLNSFLSLNESSFNEILANNQYEASKTLKLRFSNYNYSLEKGNLHLHYMPTSSIDNICLSSPFIDFEHVVNNDAKDTIANLINILKYYDNLSLNFIGNISDNMDDDLYILIIKGQKVIFGYSQQALKTLLVIKDKQIVDSFQDYFTNAIFDDYFVVKDKGKVISILESKLSML